MISVFYTEDYVDAAYAFDTTRTELLDRFGFDTVDAGPLKEGWRIQRGTPS